MTQLEDDAQFDTQGYLKDYHAWSESIAHAIAANEQVTLTPDHWEVIYLLRDFYQTYHMSPAVRPLVNAMKEKYGEERGNSRYLFRLFPDGPAKQATKIAGLPKPAQCL